VSGFIRQGAIAASLWTLNSIAENQSTHSAVYLTFLMEYGRWRSWNAKCASMLELFEEALWKAEQNCSDIRFTSN